MARGMALVHEGILLTWVARKNFCYRKSKKVTRVRKYQLGNEQILFCWRHGFLDDVEIKVVFILKISCFLFARFWHLTLKGFRSSAYRCSSRKYKTFGFFQWFGGFSCAIQEKFTVWRTSSTSNFTWKIDIALRFVRFRFLAWKLT